MRFAYLYVGCFLCSLSLAAYSHAVHPELSLSIEGLRHCNDEQSRVININPQQDLSLLVHGCNASAGSFVHLSEVLAYQGQQSICFSYNDRHSLTRSVDRLTQALKQLHPHLQRSELTVLAHSQGGLIARKALTSLRYQAAGEPLAIKLVTVSAPLSGIAAAKYCGRPWLRIATLGIHDLLCWVISGDKWHEITDASDFIQQPGDLAAEVSEYLLVATDERNSCRFYSEQGECSEGDFVFSLQEQRLPLLQNGRAKFEQVQIQAGHAGVVGSHGIPPHALIHTLIKHGYLPAVAPSEAPAFQAMLQRVYH